MFMNVINDDRTVNDGLIVGGGCKIVIPQGTPFPVHPGLNHCSSLCMMRRTGKLGPVPVHALTSGPWCVWFSAGQMWA